MRDITGLILADHEEFRRRFAALDELDEPEELLAAWRPLAEFLDIHAAAEEQVYYPHLLHTGNDAQDETLDAIGDHNEIRDATHEAQNHPPGSPEWWAAVRAARVANSEHMAEEEDNALADFRRTADPGLRDELGRKFEEFKAAHPDTANLDTSDIDPSQYVAGREAGSLGLGPMAGLEEGGST